jgi:hypothetical protein
MEDGKHKGGGFFRRFERDPPEEWNTWCRKKVRDDQLGG